MANVSAPVCMSGIQRQFMSHLCKDARESMSADELSNETERL